MKIKIRSRYDSTKILFECDSKNKKEALEKAIKESANLRGADLCEANLSWADLRGADLSWADLRGANLRGADLRGANLLGVDLRSVKVPSFNDHYFISEVLLREAKEYKHRAWAGSIRISLDWCWKDFLEKAPKAAIAWAKKILCEKWPEFEEKFKQ